MSERIVVVKVGSSVIVEESGDLDYTAVANLARDLMAVESQGICTVLVTSGAISAGQFRRAGMRGTPKKQRAQLFAAIGQPRLVDFYRHIFAEYGKVVGQLLLTRDAFASRSQYFSIRDTLRALLSNGVLPLINDNDVLHKEDITFSDNDHLAAYVAGMLNAELVVLLSSVKGLYRDFAAENPKDIVHRIEGDFEEVETYVSGARIGRGGMRSKVNAAKLLYDLGIQTVIASGRERGIVSKVLRAEVECTRFIAPKVRELSGIRKWLCTGAIPRGTIIVSPYGGEVIRRGDTRGSLLSNGVLKVSGEFNKGDVVCVCNEEGRLLGYGITKLSSEEIIRVGKQVGVVIIHANYFYGTDYGYFSEPSPDSVENN